MADTTDPTRPTAENAPAEDHSGRVLSDFELVRRIGVGGMGQVYLARQRSLKRQVAIKILRGELAANVTALRRFQAEAEAVANITHAHIVQVYAIGEDQGLHYMALEYMDGRNLRDELERKGVPELPHALKIMRQVASALERAGELGFVHRDIKPENILQSKKGEVKVADFGLSRCFTSDAPLNLTQSGVTMGTPLYMSPEQVRGQPVDPRSDIYSFGVTCFHMLAGEPPFRGATAFDVALQHVQGEVRPLGSIRPDLPPELCAIVHKMMARRPEDRYQSAREILNDLDRLKDGVGLLPVAAPTLGSSVFVPALGSSGTSIMPVGQTSLMTQAVPASVGLWRYIVVGLLALSAVGGGAALHWSQTPTAASTSINPNDALADIDPPPSSLHEKDLKRRIHEKGLRVDAVADDLLELAELYIKDRRFDDALKLFDADAVRKLGAFDSTAKSTGRDAELVNIISGLGKGIVLAYQDRADDSIAEFLKVMRAYPPTPLKKDVIPPKVRPAALGLLEQFFSHTTTGANWKRLVGEALDRDEKNLGKLPDEMKRLRLLPAKGPIRG
ncbi:MAG TPA: serine/threonine-protein kinase [Gemmataceae bacterium]|jgi:serine/threonine-protein kinase|nr:serine/threonine-protein kinase [Gemmataceae bacterium]